VMSTLASPAAARRASAWTCRMGRLASASRGAASCVACRNATDGFDLDNDDLSGAVRRVLRAGRPVQTTDRSVIAGARSTATRVPNELEGVRTPLTNAFSDSKRLSSRVNCRTGCRRGAELKSACGRTNGRLNRQETGGRPAERAAGFNTAEKAQAAALRLATREARRDLYRPAVLR
jgi:hypothetical protein